VSIQAAKAEGDFEAFVPNSILAAKAPFDSIPLISWLKPEPAARASFSTACTEKVPNTFEFA
jgi:hypothetical protein